jgi:mannitol-1-phosphate/altronate dehydrogenase
MRQHPKQRPHIAQEVFTAFARLRDPELGDWVEVNVWFPNLMVDRITPVTTDDDRIQIKEQFGVEDAWPVVCEPITQWALEDDPSGGGGGCQLGPLCGGVDEQESRSRWSTGRPISSRR